MIDWTKECETCEDQPRPVRVLATDLNGPKPVAVSIDGELVKYTVDGSSGINVGLTVWPQLRNVAPKPVRREAWVGLLEDGMTDGPWKEEAFARNRPVKIVEVRHIVWNSDGSPVEDDRVATLEKDNAALEAERDYFKAEFEDQERNALFWRSKAEALEYDVTHKWQVAQDDLRKEISRQRDAHAEQIKRMQEQIDGEKYYNKRVKPVVDAAVAWRGKMRSSEDVRIFSVVSANLMDAVDAYQQGESEKSCNGCKMEDGLMCTGFHGTDCIRSDHSEPGATDKWEPRR